MIAVTVVGASGYAGGEVLRLLLQHPLYEKEFTLGALTGASNAGTPMNEIAPHLLPLYDRVLQETREDLIAEHDLAFLALPHGVSSSFHLPEDMMIVDCGADYRLKNSEDWVHYYGGEHPGTWVYGIPEMPAQREKISDTNHVAIPGCFPTGATLAMAPALRAGLISPQVSVVSITGVSGAGKKAAVNLLGSETMGTVRSYNVGTHRHTPEIRQNMQQIWDYYCDNSDSPAVAEEEPSVIFTPVLAPLTRGILSTVTAVTDYSESHIRKAYQEYCEGEPFLYLLPEGQQPDTKAVMGTNMTHLQIAVSDGKIVMTSAIDNLVKGTAGAAVQCFNLMMGWEETLGLPIVGLHP